MQSEFRADELALACRLADVLLARFEDPQAGGFYFVSNDHETLIHRPKQGHDGATPSGNGIAAYALQRLGHLAGDTRYLDAARRTLELFYPVLERQPGACVSLATALEEHLVPPQVVILRGAPNEVEDWKRRLDRVYRPATLTIGIGSGADTLPAALDKPWPASGVQAWVCRGVSCLPPIGELAELERSLGKP